MDGAPSSIIRSASSDQRGRDEDEDDGGGRDFSAGATNAATTDSTTGSTAEDSAATGAAATGIADENDDAPTQSFAAAAASAAAASSSSSISRRVDGQRGVGGSRYVYRDYSRVPPEDEEEGSSETASAAAASSLTASLSSSTATAGPSPPPAAAAPSIAASTRVQKLPVKLYDILAQPSLQHIVSWLPHGRAWKVHLPKAFVEDVMPRYFEYPKYNSFIRLVNAWGFRRLNTGFDRGAYFHELFLRGLPHLHKRMRRLLPTEKKVELSHEEEPDLRAISREHPIPELPELSEPIASNAPEPVLQPNQLPPSQELPLAGQQSQVSIPNAMSTRAFGAIAGSPTLRPTQDPTALLPRIMSSSIAATLQPTQPNPLSLLVERATIAAAAAQRQYLEANAALLRAQVEERNARERTLLHLSRHGLTQPPTANLEMAQNMSAADTSEVTLGTADASRAAGIEAAVPSQPRPLTTSHLRSRTFDHSLSSLSAAAALHARQGLRIPDQHRSQSLMGSVSHARGERGQEEGKDTRLDDDEGQIHGGHVSPRNERN